ncbi:hypothetical protein APHAL10511_007197 [Amanita phalloides]|nr:hypothetical protein APHAL10511_007197 [Amanita phalloides]
MPQSASACLQLDKAQNELGLYKAQLDLAHQEIEKAQETVARVDRARARAEEQAARERSRVRQLMEKIAIDDALHQGREVGFREGLERGKILAWAELMSRRLDPNERESGRRSSQSVSRPSSVSSSSTRRGTTPRPQNADVDPLPVRLTNRNLNNATPVSDRQRSSSLNQPHPVQASSQSRPSNLPPASRSLDAPSIVRPTYQIPPDGYIPTVEAGSVISLPPPHELSRPLSPSLTRGGRPGSSLSTHKRDTREYDTLREQTRTPYSWARTMSTLSGESRSTNLSQYEMVRSPHIPQNPDNTTHQWQTAVADLHGIAGYENTSDERATSTLPLPQMPSSLSNPADAQRRLSPSSSPAIYFRPLRDEIEHESHPTTSEHASTPRPANENNGETNIGIDVVSASNSPSNTTPDTLAESGLLTPNHNRALNHTPRHSQTSDMQMATEGLIVLPSNELPLGFVPTSPVSTSQMS